MFRTRLCPMEKKRITILPHVYNDNDYFLLKFNYDESLVSIARSLGCRWVVPEEGWAIYRSRENLKSVVRAFSDISIVDTSKIGKIAVDDSPGARFREVPEEYSNALIRKGFNEETINIYRSMFREFLNHFPERQLKDIAETEVRSYLEDQTLGKKISGKTQKQLIEAINAYYVDILKRKELIYPLEKPEQKEKSRRAPTKKELSRMQRVTKNPKHKAIMSLLHSTGLKRNELIDLKREDLDLKKRSVKVKTGKEPKGKTIPLEKETSDLLEHYLELYKPEKWLFEGEKGKQYANSSILSILRRASFKAGLDKRIPKSKRNPGSEINWGS